MRRVLASTADYIEDILCSKGRVLVHCAAGISRSATVVIAFLMAKRKHSLRSAFEHTLQCRRAAWPNNGFMALLISLERAAGGEPTICHEEYVTWGQFDTESYHAARRIERPWESAPGPASASSPARVAWS